MKKLLFGIFIAFAFLFGGCFTMVGTTIESTPAEESCVEGEDSNAVDGGVRVEDSDVNLNWFTSSHLALGFSFGYIHGPWYYNWEYPYYYWDNFSDWYYWYRPHYGWYKYPRYYTPHWYRNYEHRGHIYRPGYRRWFEHPRARIEDKHPKVFPGKPGDVIRQPRNYNIPREGGIRRFETVPRNPRRNERQEFQHQRNSNSPQRFNSPSYNNTPRSVDRISPGNSYNPGRSGNSAGRPGGNNAGNQRDKKER